MVIGVFDMKYKFSTLLLFIIIEVFLFKDQAELQFLFSIVEYLFVIFCYARNKKLGILYFVTFTLLCMGEWSYVINESPPYNFYGLRIAGFSVNILTSLVLFIDVLISNKKKLKNFAYIKKFKWIFFYIFFIFIVGLINLMSAKNYFDNFISDIFTYLPLILYVYLISVIDLQSLMKLVKYCISVTVISYVLSYITNTKFAYFEGQEFLLMNAFSFIVPFAVYFLKDLYSKKIYYLQIIIVSFFILTGQIFISGKFIFIFILVILWFISKTKYKLIIYSSLIVLSFFTKPILETVKDNFSSSVVISWKIQQVEEGILAIGSGSSEVEGSFGNLFNEGRAILDYFDKNNIALFTGKGMGGGVPDTFNKLAPLAGNSGYALQDRDRNDYFVMHLSILDLFLKAGVIWLSLFLFFLFKQFNNIKIFGFITFVLLFTVFYTSKEMMLLTVIFYSISLYTMDNNKEKNKKIINEK